MIKMDNQKDIFEIEGEFADLMTELEGLTGMAITEIVSTNKGFDITDLDDEYLEHIVDLFASGIKDYVLGYKEFVEEKEREQVKIKAVYLNK